MIEILVKYIQDKGFQVDVFPGLLCISKEVNGLICSRDWAISSHNLIPDLEECLYYDATRCCEQIDREIAKSAYEEKTHQIS